MWITEVGFSSIVLHLIYWGGGLLLNLELKDLIVLSKDPRLVPHRCMVIHNHS